MSWGSIVAVFASIYFWISGWLKERRGAERQRAKDIEESQKAAEEGKRIDEEVDKMDDAELDDELDHYRGA